MNPNEAMELTAQMKHHYRAFEKLEEVIQMVAQSDNLLKEIEKSRERAKEEIVQLTEQKKKLQEEISANVSADGVKYEDFKQNMNMKITALKQAYENEVGQYNVKIKELQNSTLVAEQEFKAQQGSYNKRLSELSSLIADEESRLAATRKAIEDIKAKL